MSVTVRASCPPLRRGGHLRDVEKQPLGIARLELVFGGDQHAGWRRTARLRLDVDPGDLEVVRCIQRTCPAPDGIQRVKRGKQVPLQHDQFPDQSPLLVITESLVAAALEEPVPPPSARQEPLHGLLFGLGQHRSVDDVSTEPEKDVPLLGNPSGG